MDSSLLPRQSSSGDELLCLLSNPFSSEVGSVSIYASFAWTIAFSLLLALCFCLLRPRTNAVYAPRAKHADEKHAPPRLDKGLFSWVGPIKNTKEEELVSRIGLDAVVFLRFLRMLRNIFLIMTVIGLAVVLPINYGGSHIGESTASKRQATCTSNYDYSQLSWLIRLTPQFSQGSRFWGYTVVAYVFDIVICGLVWWNYRAVTRLRRAYLQSPEYQSSLHSRTLMVTHVPPPLRTDEGLVRLVGEVNATREMPTAAIARNVKELPDLIEDHEKAVLKLEQHLSKYLKDPNNLPSRRPTCKPFKNDRARDSHHEVDAIEYLTGRIRQLEVEINQVRETIDQRNPMPYGFASYTRVEDAHAVAYASRSKGPQGSVIRLAPKPNDLIWKNLAMSSSTRRSRAIWNGTWMVVLTVLYVIPNILTAVFLSDFANLGRVWPAFNQLYNNENNRNFFGVLQGILAPLVQSLFYLGLPVFFRRLLSNSGDTTKTSRERHVASRLFIFYIFNQLIIFSLFSSLWGLIAVIIENRNNTLEAVENFHVFSQLVSGLCNATPYWITWQLQRNLSAAVDMAQLWPLIYGSFRRRLGNPTPRETIELSAPQPFDYASYYNSYLFAAAVGLCYATLNPLILPITAVFISLDSWLKKYLLQYIAFTRVESGGMFWRMAINRLLFSVILSNVVMALVVGSQGIIVFSAATTKTAAMLYAMIPLPFLILGFKWYLSQAFDSKIRYYSTQALGDMESSSVPDRKPHRRDRVGVRFGNPALWKKLKTPMVSSKAQHVLPQIYSGRLDANEMAAARAGAIGRGDIYMSQMDHDEPGKARDANAPFELVSESDMDFENFKKRADFREEFGGEGELYSRPSSRATSLTSMSTMMGGGMYARHDTGSPSSSRASSKTRQDQDADAGGVTYPQGYVAPMRSDSPNRMAYGRSGSTDITADGHPAFRYDSNENQRGRLMNYAAGMGQATPGAYTPYRAGSGSRPQTPGTPATPMDDYTSYDYFRRGRA